MFGGLVKQLTHDSLTTKTPMNFSVYLPPQASQTEVPALYWLSGLTCTDENFLTKAGAQKKAAELGIALIMPDTSPRGAGVDGEDDAYDFGSGAGFYCDAVNGPWKENYNMYSYVTKELPAVITESFPMISAENQGIFGHSMGGHGALVCALRNPGKYRSVSAFAPISNPMQCPWGKKAFEGYLGAEDVDLWKQYDATELARKYDGAPLNILVDQGKDDTFYVDKQLLPENLRAACEGTSGRLSLDLRLQDGYDHSYYFIATFMDDHLDHHAKSLLN